MKTTRKEIKSMAEIFYDFIWEKIGDVMVDVPYEETKEVRKEIFKELAIKLLKG